MNNQHSVEDREINYLRTKYARISINKNRTA